MKQTNFLLRMLVSFAFVMILTIAFSASRSAAATHYLRPYNSYGGTVYDGNTDEAFTMMGERYIHGFVRDGWYNGSWVLLDLRDGVTSVSFLVGHVDGGDLKEGTLKIYFDGDDQTYSTMDLKGDMITQTVTLDTTGHKSLYICLDSYIGKYGLANIVMQGAHDYEYALTKTATTTTDGELTYTCKDCGATKQEVIPAMVNCTNDLLPYQVKNMDTWSESFASSKYFQTMNKRHYLGVTTTQSYSDSEAYFNLSGKYNSVSFTVGHRPNPNDDNRTAIMYVYVDGMEVKKETLHHDMVDKTFSFNTSGAQQLKIVCEEDYARYAFYDIKGDALDKTPRAHSFTDQVLQEAEFATPGLLRHICSVCGAYYTSSSPGKTRDVSDDDLSITLNRTEYTYNGKAKRPSVTVKYDDTVLRAGVDYKVTYKNNTKPGLARVEVTGLGYYVGATSQNYYIYPGKASISSVKRAGKTKAKVRWKNASSQGISGYEIAYSTYSKSNYPYTKRVGKSKTTSCTISRLSRKTNYYVRIRYYKVIKGTRYYGAWSSEKRVKTK